MAKLKREKSNVRIKNKLLSYLIDYFLVVVLTTTFYFILFNPSLNELPDVKTKSEDFYITLNQNEKIIEETKLDKFNLDSYIKMSIKASLDDSYFKGTDFVRSVPLNKENDTFYNYYFVYKINNIKDYSVNENETYLPDAYFNKINEFYNINEDYYILKKDVAIDVGEYIFNNKNHDDTTYLELKKCISDLMNDTINDLKTNNLTYKKNDDKLNLLKNEFLNLAFLKLNLSFFLSYILLILLPTFIFKSHKTIGRKVMKVNLDASNNLKWLKLSSYALINIVLFYSSTLISGFLSLGPQMAEVLFLMNNNIHINLILLLGTFLTLIFNFILPLLNKDKLMIEEMISLVRLKDEVIVDVMENERLDEKEDATL